MKILSKSRLLILFFVYYQSVFANSSIDFPPGLPLPKTGIDEDLVGTKSVEKYFGDRISDSNCYTEVKNFRVDYKKALKKVNDLLKSPMPVVAELDDAEINLRASRKKYVLKMKDCGECAVRDFSKIPGTNSTFVSDASCYFERPKLNEAEFGNAISFLTTPEKYRYQQDPIGLFQIINFYEVKIAAGKFETVKPEKIEPRPSGFEAYISVLGPPVPGFNGWVSSFSYLLKSFYETTSQEGRKEFFYRFTGLEKPPGSTWPKVKFQSLSKKSPPKETVPVQLESIVGMWYLSEAGYLRYYTAAEFPALPFKFVEDYAEESHLDAVLRMSELIGLGG